MCKSTLGYLWYNMTQEAQVIRELILSIKAKFDDNSHQRKDCGIPGETTEV